MRDCVAHRRGWVVPEFDLDGTGSLRVAFLRPILSYEGKEITEPTLLEGPGQLVPELRECESEWKPGEQVRLDAEDLQAIAMTIYLDAGKVAQEVLAYLQRRVPGVSPANATEPARPNG